MMDSVPRPVSSSIILRATSQVKQFPKLISYLTHLEKQRGKSLHWDWKAEINPIMFYVDWYHQIPCLRFSGSERNPMEEYINFIISLKKYPKLNCTRRLVSVNASQATWACQLKPQSRIPYTLLQRLRNKGPIHPIITFQRTLGRSYRTVFSLGSTIQGVQGRTHSCKPLVENVQEM